MRHDSGEAAGLQCVSGLRLLHQVKVTTPGDHGPSRSSLSLPDFAVQLRRY